MGKCVRQCEEVCDSVGKCVRQCWEVCETVWESAWRQCGGSV